MYENYKKYLEDIISNEFINSFVKLLLEESKRLQRYYKKHIKVALLGPEGTFSEEACDKFFGSVNKVYCNDFEEIFNLVENYEVDFGVIPIENTSNGTIGIVLDLLLEKDVKISGEIILDINLCLLSLEKDLKDLKEIFSNVFALSQCKNFLQKLNLPLREFPSTAEAARYVVKNRIRNVGIIGSKILSEKYGLNVLAENIQDRKFNRTRFIIISKNFIPEPTGMDKTSVAFSIKDEPGQLYMVLKEFAVRKVNLKRIESRPDKKNIGKYIFFLDFEGHIKDDLIKDIVENIRRKVIQFKFLGSYKMWC